MRYLCVHCDEKFELAAEAEPRCPRCLRLHGLRALSEAPAPPRPGSARRGLLAAAFGLLLLAAGAAGYFLYRREQVEPEPAELLRTPLDGRVLERALERRGVKGEALARLLLPDDAVEGFAERAAASATGPAGKARAVVKALQARAAAKAFVAWSLSEPRAEPPLTAEQAAAAIARDGARKQLYPLEVAALAVAALRALDVPAMLAEVYDVAGERAPLDPSGRFGYFAVALIGEPGAAPQLLDAYGGRDRLAAKGQAVLSDIEAVGAALSLRAGARLARNEDPAQALRDADAAVALLPGSPSVRTQRATVLLASAASEPGTAELQAAAQIASDSARSNNLAMLHLAKGDGERAAREVSQALAEHPDYALAHVTLAAVQLASGEREQARAALQRAEALAPDLHALALTWAQFHASAGQVDAALSYAERAVEARPEDPQSRLLLAGLYRQAARYDDMRAQARAVLQRTPAALQSRMRELIGRLLGPTALEPAADAADTDDVPGGSAPDAGAARAGSQTLQLDAPGAQQGTRLRLLDRESGGDPRAGPLKAQDGAPTLRLKEPGTGLTLPAP
jgi:tetratricopeptide (TPR) repeat protein